MLNLIQCWNDKMVGYTKVMKRILGVLGILILAVGLCFFLVPYFSGALEVERIAFFVGSWPVYWYGIVMGLAMVAGLTLILKLSDIKNIISAENLWELMLYILIGGIIGARLLFVVLKWSEYAGSLTAIFNIHEGGMSIHGAVLGGLMALLLYARRRRGYFWQYADLLVPGLGLGQAIGRFGNFFNQEAFGGPTNLPWKMFVAPVARPVGFEGEVFFHPTFLYESIGLALILTLLIFVYQKSRFVGQTALIYLISYSVLRFVVEYFRVDADKWGWLTVAQWASIGILLVALWLYQARLKRS